MRRDGLPRRILKRARSLFGAIWAIASTAIGAVVAFVQEQPAWAAVGVAIALAALLWMVARDQERLITEHETATAAIARRREIRDDLGAFFGEASRTLRRMRQHRILFFEGQSSPALVTTWSNGYVQWRARVRRYLDVTPELGQSYRHLFDSDEGLPEPRMGNIHVFQRVEDTMQALTIQQQRLREFMDEFKG